MGRITATACLLATCAAGGALADTEPVKAWSFSPVPVGALRGVVIPASKASAFEALIETPGDVGLPAAWEGRKLAWGRLASQDDGGFRVVQRLKGDDPAAIMVIAGHFYNPVIYRNQDYRFRFTCNRTAALYIDGRRLITTGDARFCVARVHSYEHRVGPVRFVIVTSAQGEPDFHFEMAQPGDVHFFAELPKQIDKEAHVDDYLSRPISNGLVDAVVAVPDTVKGYYRGNRFEQAGIILSLDYRGHTYFPVAAMAHNPIDPHQPVGPCEECFDPIAWDDAKPGEPFIKFGVGLYEKQCVEKSAWYDPAWLVRLFDWTTRSGKNWVEFTQTVRGPRGWAYHYVKRIVLVPGQPEMRIEHELINTGRNQIDIEQYNHNWISIDGVEASYGYVAEFPFVPAAEGKTRSGFEFNGSSISFASQEPSYVSIAGFKPHATDNQVSISTKASSASLLITGDFALSKAAMYACEQAFCFEPFVTIRVLPGEKAAWSRVYKFRSGT
ncbi:MAG: hypothetical protein P4L33_13140 [Capsulimonadaceae bacterium]|nr:hypothetical protein [Capsulimonadaceae bacterium]